MIQNRTYLHDILQTEKRHLSKVTHSTKKHPSLPYNNHTILQVAKQKKNTTEHKYFVCYMVFKSTLIHINTVYRENKIDTVDKN